MRRALTILLFVTCTITFQALAINVVAAQSLMYQEGGAPGDTTDPALDVSASSRRYVCSNGGSDSNNGLTQATAWATINKINSSWSSIPSNAIIVLCRGGSWGNSSITNKAGTTDSPTAIGAYGACTPSPYFDNVCSNAPRITGTLTLNQSSWINVRDLSARRYDISFGSHDMLLYRNQAVGPESSASNVFRAFGISYHIVFVENIATDATANDYFSIHRDSTANRRSPRDGWWLIDNICVGSGGEDCIDLAMANIDDGFDQYISKDAKVIANRFVGQPLSGYSTMTGTAAKCQNSGHYGKYFWWVGNICLGFTSGAQWNFSRLNKKEGAQISGNIIIADTASGDMFRNYGKSQNIYHNTLIHNGATGSVTILDSAGQKYDYNLTLHNKRNSSQLINTRMSNSQIISFDNNWYGLATGKTVTDGQSLSQRQSSTSFDTNSDEGAIAGLTMPRRSTYPNPNDWRDSSFLDDVTPGSGWSGCNSSNTPGALDCTGNYLGWELNPITGADNGGCGWAGLPIVGVKMTELGITGQCAPRSIGTESPRPEPPVLISAQ